MAAIAATGIPCLVTITGRPLAATSATMPLTRPASARTPTARTGGRVGVVLAVASSRAHE
ncbi:MAG: hypothetical protein ACR2KV_13160 [Solirubrobacteraceae bacterium]